jgi:hypothetical protein
MTCPEIPDRYYRLTLTFTRDEWTTLRQLREQLGTNRTAETAKVATLQGIALLSVGETCRYGGFQLSMKLPWRLWERIRALASERGNTNKGEIIAALTQWVETAENEKGPSAGVGTSSTLATQSTGRI